MLDHASTVQLVCRSWRDVSRAVACSSLDCSSALLHIRHLKDRAKREAANAHDNDDLIASAGGFCIEELLQVSFRMSNLLEIRCTSTSLMTTMAGDTRRAVAHTCTPFSRNCCLKHLFCQK
jgi:hypothetical protein